MWYEGNKRQINWKNRIESSEIDPYFCAQLIFDQGTKSIQWVKKDFLTNGIHKYNKSTSSLVQCRRALLESNLGNKMLCKGTMHTFTSDFFPMMEIRGLASWYSEGFESISE